MSEPIEISIWDVPRVEYKGRLYYIVNSNRIKKGNDYIFTDIDSDDYFTDIDSDDHAQRGKKTIRGQLEDVIKGLRNELTFHKLDGLTIDSKTLFKKGKSENIHIFAGFADHTTLIKDTINEIVIKDRMATLEEIIRDNNDKVRLFTTVDVMGKGIHYTKIESSSDQRLGVPKLGLKVRSYVDIDLSDANSQELLRKVVKLTLSYKPPIGRGLYKKFGFVLSSLSTGSPICLLSGDRFLKIEEIYSIDYMTTDDDILYDNIDITEFFGIFDIIEANKKWQRNNKYYPYSLSNEDLELF